MVIQTWFAELSERWQDIVQTLGVIGAAWIVALLLHQILLRIIRHNPYVRKYDGLGPRIASRIVVPSRWLLLFLATQVALPATALTSAWEERAMHIVMPPAVMMLGWLMVGLTKAVGDWAAYRFSWQHSENNLDARRVATQLRGILRVVSFILIGLTIIGVAMTIPSLRNLGLSLFASAGVAGIAVGIAAQQTLSNILAGIQIALSQPIRLDDAVIVEGEYARVEEIGTCFVVLRVWDDRRLIVPLSYFIEKPFQNWTHSSSELLGTVMLYVDYSMPLAPIRQEFERILAETKEWDKRVKAVQVTDTTNQHMEIRLLMSAVNSAVLFDLRCIVREKMLDFLQAHYSDHLPLERQLHSELGDLDTHEHKAA